MVTFYYKLIIQIWGAYPDYIIIYIKNINRKKKIKKVAIVWRAAGQIYVLVSRTPGIYHLTTFHNAPEGFVNHIMQMTLLFNIINSYNVVNLTLFFHRNMYMFVFLFWHLVCSFKKQQQHYEILIFYNNITWNFLQDRIIWFVNRST